MCRVIVTLVSCSITIDQRWAVGAVAGAHDETDLPVARDPRARAQAWIPATSLVGSLRPHLGESAAHVWLGSAMRDFEDAPSATVSESSTIQAGRLRVLGTRPIEASPRTRGTTAVSRERGAADGRTLRTEESVEPTEVTLLMEHNGAADTALLNLLASWRPVIGRGRGIGLGAARVSAVSSVTLDLSNPEHLTWWLGDRTAYLLGSGGLPDGLKCQHPTATPLRNATAPMGNELVVAMTAVEPIHVGVGDSDERVTPLLRGKENTPYIPGSSWKGVFRHRVDFILDVVGATDLQRDGIAAALFGSQQHGRGLLTFGDSPIKDTQTQPRTHVAIDRFAGGARDGSLFTLDSVPRGSTFTLHIGGAAAIGPVENLLNHVIRDLSEGVIGVGGHGSRGYGWVARSGDPPALGAVDVPALYAALVPPPPQQPPRAGVAQPALTPGPHRESTRMTDPVLAESMVP